MACKLQPFTKYSETSHFLWEKYVFLLNLPPPPLIKVVTTVNFIRVSSETREIKDNIENGGKGVFVSEFLWGLVWKSKNILTEVYLCYMLKIFLKQSKTTQKRFINNTAVVLLPRITLFMLEVHRNLQKWYSIMLLTVYLTLEPNKV